MQRLGVFSSKGEESEVWFVFSHWKFTILEVGMFSRKVGLVAIET